MKDYNLLEEGEKIVEESRKEAKRALINRWRENMKNMNIPYFDIMCKNYKKELDAVIEEIVGFMKKESEEKFIFLGEKCKSYTTLNRIEDLNIFLLSNILTKEERKTHEEEALEIKELKNHITKVIRFDKSNQFDLYDILQNFIGDIFEPLKEKVDDLDDDSLEELFDIKNTEFLLATDDIFSSLFIQLLVYRFVHEGVSKNNRLIILEKVYEELIKKNEMSQAFKSEYDSYDINSLGKLTKKTIYILLYKFFVRYKSIYQGELLKEIQKIIVNDSSFEFENISILEIIEYFDSLEQKEGESKLTSSWTEKEMLQNLSLENKKRDNLLKQKIGIIDEIIELMRYSQGRNLNTNNFKNIKVIYHEFFKNTLKLPSSRCTPKQQFLNFYKVAIEKRKGYKELCKKLIGSKNIEDFNWIYSDLTNKEIEDNNKQFKEISTALLEFFTKEELTFFSEKITRGHYIAEDMVEEYKLLKKIEWELLNYKILIFGFNSETHALIEVNDYIGEIIYFMELLAAEYNLNDYKSISINDLLV